MRSTQGRSAWAVPVVMVERYVGGVDARRLAELVDDTDRALTAARLPGLTHVGSVALPGDDATFCVFHGTRDDVLAVDRLMGIPGLRVVEGVSLRGRR